MLDPTAPLVTVVIPCWNAEAWVGRAIRSVLDQPFPNKEIIVLDDGSTDKSLAVIASFGSSLRWETGPNRGACAARNRGLDLASAQLVLFLDADDHLEGDMIGGLVASLGRDGADLAFGPCIQEDADGSARCLRSFDGKLSVGEAASRIVRFDFVQSGSALWKAGFLRHIGGWDESLLRLQDFFLFLHAIARSPNIAFSRTGACVYTSSRGAGRIRDLRTPASERSVLAGYASYLPAFETLLETGDRMLVAERIRHSSLLLSGWGFPDDAARGFALSADIEARAQRSNQPRYLGVRMKRGLLSAVLRRFSA